MIPIIMLAIAGLYMLLSVEVMVTGEPLKTKNKEKIRLTVVENDKDAAIPSEPHFMPTIKKKIIDKYVKRPHKK